MNEKIILLKDLQELLTNKEKYFQSTMKGHQGVTGGNSYRYDGVQGEYDETFKYYKHPGLPEDVFMRETYHTDSYGNDPQLYKVEFVQGKEKTITIYEPV